MDTILIGLLVLMLGFVLGSAMEFLNGQIDLDEQGYIKLTSHNTATNVEVVFAAGDVADLHRPS